MIAGALSELGGLTRTCPASLCRNSPVFRIFFNALVLTLFAWNAALGGQHALLMCLHTDGSGHFLAGPDGADEPTECGHGEVPTALLRPRFLVFLGNQTGRPLTLRSSLVFSRLCQT